MKKFLSFALSLLLITFPLSFACFGMPGNPSPADYNVLVLNVENERGLMAVLRNIRINHVSYDGCIIRLVKDMDLTPFEDALPVGTSECPFDGTFDGQGHSVFFSFNIPQEISYEPTGFFGFTKNAVIKNLNLVGKIDGANCAAALVGDATDTVITNCSYNVDLSGSCVISRTVVVPCNVTEIGVVCIPCRDSE